MKNILHTLVLFLIINVISFANPIRYNVHKIVLVNNNTQEQVTQEINEIITITDYSLKITSGAEWNFVGKVVQKNNTTLYVMSEDERGTRCRVWVRALNANDWLIYIQYSDYTIFYYCTIM